MQICVLLCIMYLFFMQTIIRAMVIVPCKAEERLIRTSLLEKTPLSLVLCNMIIAYMDEYHILNRLKHTWVTTALFSPDRKLIVTGGVDGLIKIWDREGKSLIGEPLENDGKMIRSISFDPRGVLMAVAGEDYKADIWNLASRTLMTKLLGHNGFLQAVSFDAGGDFVATASDDQTVRVWDIATARSVVTFNRHTDFVCSASFGMKNSLIASAGNDRKTYIWDNRSGKLVYKLPKHAGDVNSVSFRSDDQVVITASDDKTVRLWDVRQTKTTHDFSINKYLNFASFDHEGKRIVVTSNSKRVRLLDAHTGSVVQELNTTAKPVFTAAFSFDDSEILTTSGNRALLWSLAYDAYQKRTFSLS